MFDVYARTSHRANGIIVTAASGCCRHRFSVNRLVSETHW